MSVRRLAEPSFLPRFPAASRLGESVASGHRVVAAVIFVSVLCAGLPACGGTGQADFLDLSCNTASIAGEFPHHAPDGCGSRGQPVLITATADRVLGSEYQLWIVENLSRAKKRSVKCRKSPCAFYENPPRPFHGPSLDRSYQAWLIRPDKKGADRIAERSARMSVTWRMRAPRSLR